MTILNEEMEMAIQFHSPLSRSHCTSISRFTSSRHSHRSSIPNIPKVKRTFNSLDTLLLVVLLSHNFSFGSTFYAYQFDWIENVIAISQFAFGSIDRSRMNNVCDRTSEMSCTMSSRRISEWRSDFFFFRIISWNDASENILIILRNNSGFSSSFDGQNVLTRRAEFHKRFLHIWTVPITVYSFINGVTWSSSTRPLLSQMSQDLCAHQIKPLSFFFRGWQCEFGWIDGWVVCGFAVWMIWCIRITTMILPTLSVALRLVDISFRMSVYFSLMLICQ